MLKAIYYKEEYCYDKAKGSAENYTKGCTTMCE